MKKSLIGVFLVLFILSGVSARADTVKVEVAYLPVLGIAPLLVLKRKGGHGPKVSTCNSRNSIPVLRSRRRSDPGNSTPSPWRSRRCSLQGLLVST